MANAIVNDSPGRRSRLIEVTLLFVRLGATAFGGPAAHISMMEHEVVRRRQWLTRDELLDYLAACNLIPGPNSTELALYIGHARAGWPGLFAAGAAFIIPAMCAVMAIAWAYARYGTLPQTAALLYGVKPVVIAIVAQALWGFGTTTLRSAGRAALACGAVIAAALGAHELLVLAGSAVALAVAHPLAKRARRAAVTAPAVALVSASAVGGGAATGAAAASAPAPFGLAPLFFSCLKTGAVLFGSGYVLLAFFNAEFVIRNRWLTEQQLIDAAAVGLITPGPVFTTATFVGYVLGGPRAAIVATIGIFLPAFLLVAASIPIVRRLRQSAAAAAILQGVAIGSLALMGIVAVQLARAALVDPLTIAIAIASGVALVTFRPNATWLIVAGAAVGLLHLLI